MQEKTRNAMSRMFECEKQETNIAGPRKLIASVTSKKDEVNLERAMYLKVDDDAYMRAIVYIISRFVITRGNEKKSSKIYHVINRVETEWKRARIMKFKKIVEVFDPM